MAQNVVPMNSTFEDVFDETFDPFDTKVASLGSGMGFGGGSFGGFGGGGLLGSSGGDLGGDLGGGCGGASLTGPSLTATVAPPPLFLSQPLTSCTPSCGASAATSFPDQYNVMYADSGPYEDAGIVSGVHFGTCATPAGLQKIAVRDLTIAEGDVSVRLGRAVSQAVTSIRMGGKEYLFQAARGALQTTAAVDVPPDANDKVTRVNEAGAVMDVFRSSSRVLGFWGAQSAAFTRTRAAHWLPPGASLNGMSVGHKTSLSATTVSKRVSVHDVGAVQVVRINTCLTVGAPMKSMRASVPRWIMRPEFTKVSAFDNRTKAWVRIKKNSVLSTRGHSAVVLSTANGAHALGVRIVDAPRFAGMSSTMSFAVSRARGRVPCAVVHQLGARDGSQGLAPPGTYAYGVDFLLGEEVDVLNALAKIYGGRPVRRPSVGSCGCGVDAGWGPDHGRRGGHGWAAGNAKPPARKPPAPLPGPPGGNTIPIEWIVGGPVNGRLGASRRRLAALELNLRSGRQNPAQRARTIREAAALRKLIWSLTHRKPVRKPVRKPLDKRHAQLVLARRRLAASRATLARRRREAQSRLAFQRRLRIARMTPAQRAALARRRLAALRKMTPAQRAALARRRNATKPKRKDVLPKRKAAPKPKAAPKRKAAPKTKPKRKPEQEPEKRLAIQHK
jgi:hypothetical protein